jgi:cytochrome c553
MPSHPALGAFAVLLAFVSTASAAAPPTRSANFARDVKPLLAEFCVRCHGVKATRGGVDLARFADDRSAAREHKLWQRVLDQVRSGEMPPARQPRPSAAQRALLAHWLRRTVATIEHTDPARRDPGPALARRLTRTEYDRTIRDLVGIDFNSAEVVGMPEDGGSGFENLASRLSLSAAQMEKYFTAADKILARVLGRPAGQPAGEGFNRHQAQEAQKRLLFVKPSDKLPARDAARQIIDRFARRAFRRPVQDREIERLLRLYDLAAKKGDRHENGVRLMLKAVLVSPHFLMRLEQDRASAGSRGAYPVSDHELAVRLSYFLWATMPDETLAKLADEKKLSAPGVLEQQVKRMLADHKARSLTDNFGVPWLQLRKIWHARPSQEFFPAFTGSLRGAMWGEAVTFFDHLRIDNRSVLDLLDADYTYVNEELARHYDLAGVKGPEVRKVALKPGDRRGGLLGMAGVLTMTSHTSRTSPTMRGKWVLDVIFGAPPPPPPPDAGMLKEEKQKGKAPRTFRELMAAHAIQASCAGCHRKMDPLGYALDNFDGIGRWRDKQGDQPLDTTGVLPSGERLSGPAELKQIILKRKGLFARNMVEQMLVYALGRELLPSDEQTTREVTGELQKNGYRFTALVQSIVRSHPFRYRRNADPDND